MMRIPTVLLAALLPCAASAQAGDPLKSPACAQALAALQQARTGGQGVEVARGRAASVCLGSAELPSRPSRVVQAPIAVPAPVITPPPVAPALARTPAPPPPVAIGRPAAPAYCDGGGCWSDTGQGLQHLPPNLATPGGACVPQGGVVYCP